MRKDLHTTKMVTDDCWYRHECADYQTDNCNWKCRKMQQTKFLLDLSNLRPPYKRPLALEITYLPKDTQKYINGIFMDSKFFVEYGYNAYFYGDPGAGKTSWACKILNNYFSKVAEETHFTCRGLFVSVPTLLRNIKFDIAHPNAIEDYVEFIKTIETTDIVIWDDIIQTKPTEFESQWLYSLINERMLRKLSNIFTSNLAPNELEDVDYRLYSRVCEASDCIEFTGADNRTDRLFSKIVNDYEEQYASEFDINSPDYRGVLPLSAYNISAKDKDNTAE